MAEESKEVSRIQDNWYEILELEYYPVPEEDKQKIEARIEEKRRYWLAKESDPFDGRKYKKYNNLAKSGIIQEEMLNESRRKELIKDAQKKLFEPIDDFLKYLNGVAITEEMIVEIAKKTRREENLVKERIVKSGRKIETDEYDKKIYQKFSEYLNMRFDEFSEFLAFEKYLEIINKENLYDFLISEGLDIKSLTQEKIDDSRKKLIKFDNETSAKKKLYSACELILNRKEKKEKYNEYLKYLKYLKVNKELKKIEQIYNLTENKIQADEFIDEIENILKNRDEAQSIVIGFCREKKISYDILKNSNKRNGNMINTDSIGSKNYHRYAEKSKDLCIEALRAIKERKFAEAQKYLNDAKLYWSENSSIAVLQEKLDEVKLEILQKNENTKIQAKKHIESEKKINLYPHNKRNITNVILLIILGILSFIVIYLAIIFLFPSESQSNQSNVTLNNENIISDEGEEKIISLKPSADFSVTSNELYYSGKTDTYLERIALIGNSNLGNYTSLVIENFSKKRYDMLLKNGVKGRVFKFKCGIKVKAKGTTLFIDNAVDIVSFKNKSSSEKDKQLKENNGCFIDFLKINENI